MATVELALSFVSDRDGTKSQEQTKQEEADDSEVSGTVTRHRLPLRALLYRRAHGPRGRICCSILGAQRSMGMSLYRYIEIAPFIHYVDGVACCPEMDFPRKIKEVSVEITQLLCFCQDTTS